MKNKEVIKDFKEWVIPERWEDIDLKTYQGIEAYYKENDGKSFDIRDVIHILTHKSKDEINELPVQFLDIILEKMQFISIKPEVGKPTNKITIDGVDYVINIMEKLKLGEYVAVDNVLKVASSDYASILAILCRKEGEVYDSKFEAEEFEKRKEMFEKQPVIKILPIVDFFLHLYIRSKILSQVCTRVEEGINLTANRIKNSTKIGAFKKLYLNWQMKKWKKYLELIKHI